MLTVRELATTLNVHPETLRRWTRQGLVPALRTPTGRLRYTSDAAVQFCQPDHVAASAAEEA